MICPCGCGRDVPHLRYWATDQCAKRGNKRGLRMPNHRSEFERKIGRMRRKKWAEIFRKSKFTENSGQ